MNDLRKIRRIVAAWDTDVKRLDNNTINVKYSGSYGVDVESGRRRILAIRDKLDAAGLHTMWMNDSSVNVYFS